MDLVVVHQIHMVRLSHVIVDIIVLMADLYLGLGVIQVIGHVVVYMKMSLLKKLKSEN